MEMMQQRRGWGVHALAVMAAVAVCFPASARADNMDQALRIRAAGGWIQGRVAPSWIQKLKKSGYHNVGVLRFQVQIGHQEPTFTAGLINSAMATRVENALILADPAQSPIGITRNAGAVAAKNNPKVTYLNADGQAQLFTYQYPQAWDNKSITVDAFLTGIVRVGGTMHESKVTIQVFDRTDKGKLRTFDEFTVRNDLSIFSDLGVRYSVVKRDLRLGANTSDPETAPRVKPKAHPTQTQAHGTPQGQSDILTVADHDDLAVRDLIDFTVYYDDNPVPITTKNGYTRIPPPTATTKTIRFDMSRKCEKPVAVVVLVNGQNTANEAQEGKAPIRYTKWILQDKKSYSITGYWSKDGQTVHEFQLVSGAKLATLSDLDPSKLGQIEIFVFPTVAPRMLVKRPGGGEANLRDRTETLGTTQPLEEVKTKINRAAAPIARNLFIVPGAGKKHQLIEKQIGALGDPAYLIIHYQGP
jgi:hypothetical protein